MTAQNLGPGLIAPSRSPPQEGIGGTGSSLDASTDGPTLCHPSAAPQEGAPTTPPATGAEATSYVGTAIKIETQPYFESPTEASVPSSEPCQVGDELGSYVLEEFLGQGGMGSVFRARHKILGRVVAIKVLLPELALQPDLVRRFFQEAQAVNRVHHPNVVEVTDCVFPRDRPPYLIMQYLSGQSLSRFIETNAPLAPEVAIELALQICNAMEAVHARGIVHRDLKPDNVFLVPNPRPDLPGEHLVKLLDFGIAKFLTPEDGFVKTRTGAVIGTPEYMAPEQINGGQIDHRADLYSLGAILFELLTGHPPFAATQLGQLLLKQLNEAPVAPSTSRPETQHCPIPVELDRAVLRCLAKAKDERVQTMAELGAILVQARSACTGPVVSRKPTQAMERADQSDLRRRRRWPVLVPAGLGAALLVAAGGWWFPTSRHLDRAPAPPIGGGAQVGVPTLKGLAGALALRTVLLASRPAGAVVYDLDSGQHLGQTPLPVAVAAGRRRSVELRLTGHAPHRVLLPSHGASPPIVGLVPLQPLETADTKAEQPGETGPRPRASRSTRRHRRPHKRPRPVMASSSRRGESITLNPFD